MQSILLTLAITLIKWYVGTGVFYRIEALVIEMIKSDMTNEQKRQYVIDTIKKEYAMIRTRLIDMVIGSILTKLG